MHNTVIFFVIAVITALLGFGGIASATNIAKTLFILFAILAVVGFLFGLIKKQSWPRATPLLALNPSPERNHHDCYHQAIQPNFKHAR